MILEATKEETERGDEQVNKLCYMTIMLPIIESINSFYE